MQDDIERILADDEAITPSPGFLDAVMQAVRQEAGGAGRLEFPWLRALPGFVATIGALAVSIWHGIGSLSDAAGGAAFEQQLDQLALAASALGLDWVILALALAAVSAALPWWLVRFEVKKGSDPFFAAAARTGT